MLLFSPSRDRRSHKKGKVPSNGRLNKDMAEVVKDRYFVQSNRLSFPEGVSNPSHFVFTVLPEEGLYKGASFEFEFRIPRKYPFTAPQVRCTTRVLNPRIDIRGDVWLPMLRKEWKPIFGINQILFGLQLLFLEPDFSDMVDDWDQLLRMAIPNYGSLSRRDRASCVHNIARVTLAGGYFLGMFWEENHVFSKKSMACNKKRTRDRMCEGREEERNNNSSAFPSSFFTSGACPSSSNDAFSSTSRLGVLDDGEYFDPQQQEDPCVHTRKFRCDHDEHSQELQWPTSAQQQHKDAFSTPGTGYGQFSSRISEQSTPNIACHLSGFEQQAPSYSLQEGPQGHGMDTGPELQVSERIKTSLFQSIFNDENSNPNNQMQMQMSQD
jgi:ubiquitin-conjugating enzyme E2 M